MAHISHRKLARRGEMPRRESLNRLELARLAMAGGVPGITCTVDHAGHRSYHGRAYVGRWLLVGTPYVIGDLMSHGTVLAGIPPTRAQRRTDMIRRAWARQGWACGDLGLAIEER